MNPLKGGVWVCKVRRLQLTVGDGLANFVFAFFVATEDITQATKGFVRAQIQEDIAYVFDFTVRQFKFDFLIGSLVPAIVIVSNCPGTVATLRCPMFLSDAQL